jgi:hypothetical protein
LFRELLSSIEMNFHQAPALFPDFLVDGTATLCLSTGTEAASKEGKQSFEYSTSQPLTVVEAGSEPPRRRTQESPEPVCGGSGSVL